MNNLYNMLNHGNPMGNINTMLSQFNQFKQTFKGDPKAEVMRLLESGKMTQEQFNQLQSMAHQISNMLR